MTRLVITKENTHMKNLRTLAIAAALLGASLPSYAMVPEEPLTVNDKMREAIRQCNNDLGGYWAATGSLETCLRKRLGELANYPVPLWYVASIIFMDEKLEKSNDAVVDDLQARLNDLQACRGKW